MNVERLAQQLAAHLVLTRPLVCMDLDATGVWPGHDLPRTVEELHAWLYPSDPNSIDADGKLVWRDGVATVTFVAQAGTSLAALAATDLSFLDWVLRKDFSDEVKAIVEDALAGRSPVRGEAESG